MTARSPLDHAARFVADRWGARATTPVPLGAGEWSDAYSFRLDGQERVIRIGAHREDFAKDPRMGDAGLRPLPIPRVLEIGDTGSGWFAVADRARGTFLD